MNQLLRLYRNVLAVLPSDARRFIILYANLQALLALLDAAAIGVLAMVITPAASGTPVVLPWIGKLHGVGVFWALLAVSSLIIMKSFASALLLFWATRRLARYELEIGSRLFLGYMRAPWVDRLGKNSSDLVRLIDSGVTTATTTFLLPGSTLLSEVVTLGAISIVLAVAQPITALVTLIYLGFIGVILYFWIARNARVAGRVNLTFSMQTARFLMEMVSALKELTLRDKNDEIFAAVTKSRQRSTRARANVQFLGQIPRFVLESAIIGGFVLMGLTGYLIGGETEAISSIALFAIAGFRMAPSVIRFQSVMSQMASSAPYVTAVVKEITANETSGNFREPAPDAVSPGTFTQIQFQEVCFRYPGAPTDAVDHVSLTIDAGQTVAFVGPSGSGKTTVVDLLLGLLTPTSGEIAVNGVDLSSDPRSWQTQIGYVPQDVALFDGSVAQNVALTWQQDYDENRVRRALEQAHLLEVVEGREDGILGEVGERGLSLSGGQRQRLGIARALYPDPSVLVMDEATSALDSETEVSISESIKDLRGTKTVVLVAHRLSTIRHADRIFYLDRGSLVASGTFEELVERIPDFARQADLSGIS